MGSSRAVITYRCPDTGRLESKSNLTESFGPGPWVIVSPHDDDIILGMEMTVSAARQEGIEVHVVVVVTDLITLLNEREKSKIDASQFEKEALEMYSGKTDSSTTAAGSQISIFTISSENDFFLLAFFCFC